VTGAPAPVVDCRHVSRAFGRGPNEVLAVRDASLRVFPGRRLALTGESGSGKSTLLHLVAGLDTPTSGTVEWPALGVRAGRPLGVGVVFQAPSLLPELDVTENVSLPMLLAGVPPDEADDRARAALDRLELAGLAAASAEELSGSQAQRIAVARVLAAEPALVLADEPTGRLDHRTAALVVDLLLAAVAALGAALVIATHDPAVARRLDHRWALVDGRLHEVVGGAVR
jgi:ABC-type lipoprotein export system ATPase subunit